MRKALLLIFPLLALLVGILLFMAKADEVRTNESLIYFSAATSTAFTTNFSLYIGDNLSGVTNPVKSAYVVASGVYTGAGTLSFTLNGDPASTKTFNFPTAGTTPYPFELVYLDPSGKISPTSAGTYSYDLTVSPAGVTLYEFSLKLTETHRYVPPACNDGTTQKVRTNETLIYSTNQFFSVASSSPFSFYVGDNLSGITNPMKSAYIVFTGTYVDPGTIALMLDNDPASLKTFTLSDPGNIPASFELVYLDPSGKISPTSAGTYTHTLTFTPTGITVYAPAAKLVTTDQYTPPSCGGISPFGDLTSSTFDTGVNEGVAYNSFMWKGSEGTGKVKFQLATSNCSNGASDYPTCSTGTWGYKGGATCNSSDWYDMGVSPTGGPNKAVEITCAPANHNNQRYYRYKIRICSATNCTDSGATSPVVDDVIVNWAP